MQCDKRKRYNSIDVQFNIYDICKEEGTFIEHFSMCSNILTETEWIILKKQDRFSTKKQMEKEEKRKKKKKNKKENKQNETEQ